MMRTVALSLCLSLVPIFSATVAQAEGDWETTPESEAALQRGLEWLAANQGPEGNWGSKHLGLVSMGVLAFLADGHLPGRGKYGDVVERGLDYIIRNAKTSGLLNIQDPRRDMYNHGLATFVLGQAYGMAPDERLSKTLDLALKLIYEKQCLDGGWRYEAQSGRNGNDLSLAVMQAKAIRSAVDSGLEVPDSVLQIAVDFVRDHYRRLNEKDLSKGKREAWNDGKAPTSQDDPRIRIGPGQFTYNGSKATTAMAAAGVVCLQEFGQYDDWRIPKNIEVIRKEILRHEQDAKREFSKGGHGGKMPFDAYTLYYVGQSMYQVGGEDWQRCYPILRDALVNSQRLSGELGGSWDAGAHVSGEDGRLYGTSVAVFILAMPNRYLPILQEGRIESVREKVGSR